jgi:hypothetical protein
MAASVPPTEQPDDRREVWFLGGGADIARTRLKAAASAESRRRGLRSPRRCSGLGAFWIVETRQIRLHPRSSTITRRAALIEHVRPQIPETRRKTVGGT